MQEMGQAFLFFLLMCHWREKKFLLSPLRFDETYTRTSHCTVDKAAPVRQVLEMFTKNWCLPYLVEQDVVIDEMVAGFQGKWRLSQYIKSNPNKCRMKFHPLVDTAMFYVFNIELSASNQPKGLYQLINTAADIMKGLITPISCNGLNLTVDNIGTSLCVCWSIWLRFLLWVSFIKTRKNAHLLYR